MNLEELKKEENILRTQLDENLISQKSIIIQQFIERYGIDRGDKIEWQWGNIVKQGIITGWIGQSQIMPMVAPLNKDGKPSKRNEEVYRSSLKSIKLIEKSL